MGYKLAGCEVIGCCEIDPQMNKIYLKNHNPKHNYLMDIRDFNEMDALPQELYNLDILDGSPPCSTFSTAGDREKSWGKEKKFREGQKTQTLDDLLFVFIKTVAKLRPKVVVMENVEGLLLGEAWKYVQRIYKEFASIGYTVTHKLLKGENMGIPQARHRVFFIATRLGFDLNRIDLSFNYEPIPYGTYKTAHEKVATGRMSEAIKQIRRGEGVDEVMYRLYGVRSGITHRVAYPDQVYPTQTAGHGDIWTESGNHPSSEDVIHSQTFPEDYDFCGVAVEYMCGMSVPPLMMARVVRRLIESGIFKERP